MTQVFLFWASFGIGLLSSIHQNEQKPDKSLRECWANLRSTDLDTRIQAIMRLPLYRDATKTTVPLLMKVLERGDAREKMIALRSLSEIGPAANRAIPHIVPLLTPPGTSVSTAAQLALVTFKEKAQDALPPLIEALGKPINGEVDFWQRIPLTLVEIAPGDKRVGEALRKALSHSDQGVRAAAAWAMYRHEGKAEPGVSVLKSVLESADANARVLATFYLARVGSAAVDAVPALLLSMQDKEQEVRLGSLNALVAIAPERAIVQQALRRALSDNDWYVRSRAASTLGEQSRYSKATSVALQQVLTDKESSVRLNVAYALWKIDPSELKRVMPVFLDLLEDQNPIIRAGACRFLGAIGRTATAAVPALRRAADDSWDDVRQAAKKALEQILLQR